jgi:hypothetical protein
LFSSFEYHKTITNKADNASRFLPPTHFTRFRSIVIAPLLCTNPTGSLPILGHNHRIIFLFPCRTIKTFLLVLLTVHRIDHRHYLPGMVSSTWFSSMLTVCRLLNMVQPSRGVECQSSCIYLLEAANGPPLFFHIESMVCFPYHSWHR